MGRGRGSWARQHREPVRALLHHEAGRFGDRPRALAPDRRSARRHAHARKPRARSRLRGAPAPAALSYVAYSFPAFGTADSRKRTTRAARALLIHMFSLILPS